MVSALKKSRDYIIFALDVSSTKEAARYVELLAEDVGMFKVGLELFIRSGPEIIRVIKASSPVDVFLDLKLHDIPATVSRAVEVVEAFGVRFVTAHCGESPEMLEAAVRTGKGNISVLGVTVLTSISGEDIRDAGFRDEFYLDVSRLVLKRAEAARAAGCAGVVCSGREVKMIKEVLGHGFVAVTPGIRPAWSPGGQSDQKRITTPFQAIRDGSDYIVVGRPIRDAENPRTAAIRIAEEIESALQ